MAKRAVASRSRSEAPDVKPQRVGTTKFKAAPPRDGIPRQPGPINIDPPTQETHKTSRQLIAENPRQTTKLLVAVSSESASESGAYENPLYKCAASTAAKRNSRVRDDAALSELAGEMNELADRPTGGSALQAKKTPKGSAPKRRGPDIPTVAEQATLILENMESAVRIAWSMLNRWRVRLPSDEVQSVTGVALCEAASRFDRSIGVAFRTFFFYHLRGLLLREITRRIGDSRSRSILDDIDTRQQEAENGEWPISLVETSNPEIQVGDEQVSKITWEACRGLDELERDIIVRFFVYDQTVADIAKDLGYCRCHVSRVKSRALQYLSKRLRPVLADTSESNGMQHLNRVVAARGSDEANTKHSKTYRGGRGRRRAPIESKKSLPSQPLPYSRRA